MSSSAREEFIDVGDFIQATDSHTCMGGASNALTYGVGSTEYANLVHNQFAFVKVPESIIRYWGSLDPGCTAKDVIHISFGSMQHNPILSTVQWNSWPGLASLSMDERATLAIWLRSVQQRSGICEPDDLTVEWLMARR